MNMILSFVPRGGGEVDYNAEVDLPAVPQAGDYIQYVVKRPEQDVSWFRVRRAWWTITSDREGRQTELDLRIECEYAIHPLASDRHKAQYQGEGYGTGEKIEIEESMY